MKVFGRIAMLGLLLAGLVAPAAGATAPPACVHPVLVLTAMPLELSPLVAQADIDSAVRIDGRRYYQGTLGGTDVVLAMSGIGMGNATQTATTAFEHFRCSFAAAVFSGVAGSQYNIGDVAIPADWIDHDTVTSVNSAMLAVAGGLTNDSATLAQLTQDVPVGDAACLCPGVDAATPVHTPDPKKIVVGGHGETSDPFGGHAVPCVPGGGDVAGCEPCFATGNALDNTATFAHGAGLVADPTFWSAFLQPPDATTQDFDAQDEETAAVAQAAQRFGVPFLGIRAASDGRVESDPLGLPGFPWTFFVYRQLAGNNAAAVTIAFLERWTLAGQPVV